MRPIFVVLLFGGLLLPVEAVAQQAAPFCLVSNTGHKSCFYYSLQACQQAAVTLGGMCAANSQGASSQGAGQVTPIQHPDIMKSYQDGYRFGAEQKRKREEHEARMRLLEAQAREAEARAAQAAQAAQATSAEPKRQTLYRCLGADGVPFYTGQLAGEGCTAIVVYQEAELPSSAPRQLPARSRLQFHGYPCTQDCSGHEAGYDWAREKGIEDAADCGGRSQSFIEGCRAFVDENP